MIKRRFNLTRLVLLTTMILSCGLIGLSACQSGGTVTGSTQIDSAAGTATALIRNAQSTVIVMKAQSMATAWVETLNAPLPGALAQENAEPIEKSDTPNATASLATQTSPGKVEIVAVTTAADGAYIMVEFRAPVRLVDTWYQGRVSVINESTAAVYAEIPSVGTIGPLIGRPRSNGQLGYVMLVNAPVPLSAGAMVTVVLGDFKQEHLIIQ